MQISNAVSLKRHEVKTSPTNHNGPLCQTKKLKFPYFRKTVLQPVTNQEVVFEKVKTRVEYF